MIGVDVLDRPISRARLERAFLRTDLSAFIEKTFKTVSPQTKYMDNWHIDAISEYLMALYKRDIKRLIINIPPRNLKSISCTVAWPAWLLGKDPTSKIMAASYSKELSVKHSTDCRLVIESDWYRRLFPRTQIVDDQNQKTKYVTTERGCRFATSVGGTATGEGGDYLILDDPINAGEAQSKVTRDAANAWISQTWMSRLNDKENGVMLLIMQRLHFNDPTSYLLETGEWEHLVLPAQFEKHTTVDVGRFHKEIEKGEYLHPARENAATLAALKKQLGSFFYSGQYQQNPVPDGGGIFKSKWFQYWPDNKPLPTFDCIIQSVDSAFTDKVEENDPTAFTAWGVFKPGEGKPYCAMLLDAWSEHLEYPELRKKLQQEYKTRYGSGEGRRADIVLMEDKGSGISLRQDLIRGGVPVHPYNPGRADKIQRAHLVVTVLENGLIYLPESDKFPGKTYSWANEVVEQLCSFPKAEHDDYVDSTTQAWRLLRDQEWLKVDADPDEKDLPEPKARMNPYAQ